VSVTTVDPYGQEHTKDTVLWTVAALVVAALHVGLVATYLLIRPAPGDRAEAPVIDVAFMPAANTPARAAPEARPAEPTPPVEPSDLAPDKEEPDTPRQAVTEPEPPQEKTEHAPQPEPMPPPVALTTPLPEPTPPEEPAVTAPPPKHAEPLPQASKPVTIPERARHKPVTDDKAVEAKRQAVPPRPAESAASRPARMASAPNPGADSEGARAGRTSWESELAAHIRRYATYSANGSRESGTARVGVTIDRNGRLLSHRLAGSSGSSTLDSAAMTVIERAQPFPRFPPGMNQAQIALTIPLHLRPQ
jgi:periplasmic protein TonB